MSIFDFRLGHIIRIMEIDFRSIKKSGLKINDFFSSSGGKNSILDDLNHLKKNEEKRTVLHV